MNKNCDLLFHCHGGIVNTQTIEVPPGFVFHFYTEPQYSLYGKMFDDVVGFNPVEREICKNLKVKLSKNGRLFKRKAGQLIPNFILTEDALKRFQSRVTFCQPCSLRTKKAITNNTEAEKEVQNLIAKAKTTQELVKKGFLSPQRYNDAQTRLKKAQDKLDKSGRQIFFKRKRRQKSSSWNRKTNPSLRCGEILALSLIDETDLKTEMLKLTTKHRLMTSTLNKVSAAYVNGCVINNMVNPIKKCINDGKIIHVHCLFCLSNIPPNYVFKYSQYEQMYTQDRITSILILAEKLNHTAKEQKQLLYQIKKASTLKPNLRRRVYECMNYDELKSIQLYRTMTPLDYIKKCEEYIKHGGRLSNETRTWF